VNVFVGELNAFAFECVFQDYSSVEGRIFLYINGVRYGQDEFNEDICSFLERQINAERNVSVDYKKVFEMEANDIREYMKCIWGEKNGTTCIKYQDFEYDPAEIDLDIMIRAGYAFDRHFISLIPSGNYEKLVVFGPDQEKNQGSSIILKKGEFYLNLVRLYGKVCETINRDI
jgi:hypothetical protein